MALGDSLLARLPLSTSMLYLLAGVAVSPLGFGLATLTPRSHLVLLEHVAEVVVLLSLFTSGLKMSVGLSDGRWLLPLRLAMVSMLVTVAGIAAAGVLLLGLPLGAAILLGGILAPTDPVLASDVQVAEPTDRDRLRFALTGEAGLNDGTAFPFVLLGLGLLGLHDIGAGGWRWLAVDVVWGTAGGVGIGAVLGTAVGRLVLYLRRTHKEAVGLDNFLALGLIALAYGGAQPGARLRLSRRVRRRRRLAPHRAAARRGGRAGQAGRGAGEEARRAQAPALAAAKALADPDTSHAEQVATDPKHAPAFMAHAMLSFNEQIERIGEVAAVIAVGTLLWAVEWRLASWGFVAVLLVVIRPLAVAIGLAGSQTSASQRA